MDTAWIAYSPDSLNHQPRGVDDDNPEDDDIEPHQYVKRMS